MADMVFAAQNGRIIPKEDKIFGINNRAKAMIAKEGKDKVINATIGALLDDEGNLIVLSSVHDVFKSLSPVEYAEYAPISGVAGFREAIKKDLMRDFVPTRFVEAVASPGGTGAIRNTISNYTEPGDVILVADWFWAPYKTIANEQGRDITTFEFFNAEGSFNCESFKNAIEKLLAKQERLVIILNTPAHNPTGYSITEDDWTNIVAILNGVDTSKKVTLLADVAYADFAEDDENDSRKFLKYLEQLDEHVLPLVAHSLSKSYTLYGLRCGAVICMAKTEEIAAEFKSACEYASRGSWSNCARAPQVILDKIYSDPELLKKVMDERKGYRDMLLERGTAFTQAAREVGLEMVPFSAGFFATIPAPNPDEISTELEKEGIFTVPLAKGVRVSLASISSEKCRIVAHAIKRVMDQLAK